MPGIRRFFLRLITFFRASKADSDLTREINTHLRLLEDQFVAQGMTSKAARYAAKRAFGGVEQAKEHQRETRTFAWLMGWSIDLKLGVRMMRKWPGLTVIAVIALAVGIGAGAAYYDFVSDFSDFFRPKLSFPGADRLVGILNWNLAKGEVEDRSLYAFAAWKMPLTAVEELGAAWRIREDLTAEDGHTQPASGWEISASAFRVFPLPPLYGRPLLDDDERPGAEAVIVIGEDLWKARFNSNPLVIGRTVRFGEALRTVVGVMPHDFRFPISGALWIPPRLNPATIKRGEGPSIRIFGRLAPGADLDQAQAQLETIAGRMDEGRGNAAAGMRPSIRPYAETVWKEFSAALLIPYSFNLFFIALLGICAANVAQLIFARTISRESEIAVRTALGASRGRIVGQFIAEALVLASIAAIVGLAGATFALRKVTAMWDASGLPPWWNTQLGIETIAYSVLLVIIAALLVGGAPALKATGPRMNARLKEAGAGGATMRFGKLWTGVLVTQIAVTAIFLLVLVSSGWVAYLQIWRAAADVAFPQNEYLSGVMTLEEGATAERQKAVRRELQRRLNADPDVINATFAVDMPGDVDTDEFRLELPSTSEGRGDAIGVHEAVPIGSNYFETFQLPLLAGRLFTASEIEEGRNVVIVDETFVRLVLGGKSAIGQLVRRAESNGKPGPWLEIVGVVKDIMLGPNKTTADAMIYRPSAPDDNGWRIVVHSRSNEAAARLRAAASATDPQIRLAAVMTIEREKETDARAVSVIMTGLGVIVAVVLMLAAAGIHSLISFTLASRTREIGIRTALGAAPLRIVISILSPVFMKVGIGIALGSIPGIALIFAWLDWGLSAPMIAVVGASVAVFIVAVAVISSVWPARRALKIPPTEALRTT
jgi:predicted permease